VAVEVLADLEVAASVHLVEVPSVAEGLADVSEVCY
jgi:hypothetical protein